MNALGLAYDSSSGSDDDERGSPTPPAALSDEGYPSRPSQAAAAAEEDDDELEAALRLAGIPPPPEGKADLAVQARIASFLKAQQENEGGEGFQHALQAKKEVRNPYILDKVVEYFGIDELATNFAPDVFDPHALPLHEFSDALALEQKKRADAAMLRQQQYLQQQYLQQQLHGGDPSRQLQFHSAPNAQ